MSAARVRPLLARRGARFACVGDGVCCTDVHAVGPLSRRERGIFEGMHAGLIVRVGGHALLSSGRHGRCPFLEDAGCALHARLGSGAKPRVCVRFPYGLVATPLGGRVTTSHRCSCRTLGARPPLDLEAAEEALRFPSGRLYAEIRVPGPIPLTARHGVTFEQYVEREDDLLVALLASSDPRAELAKRAEPLPATSLERERALELSSASPRSRFGAAVAWLGLALRARGGEKVDGWPPRPWSSELDRAEARSAPPDDPDGTARRMLADYAADELWGLEWCGKGPLDGKLADLGRRLELGEILIEALLAQGARADRAAAEALMILDLASSEADGPSD